MTGTGFGDRAGAGAWTLPARYYTDPAIFAAEKERIFLRSWLYVGHEGQLAEPGAYLAYDIYDQGVVVMRGHDGVLRGFHNVCQHRAHRLLEGQGRVAVITCPYHAWAYGLDGALRTARGSERSVGFDPRQFGLKPVRVETFLGFVMVNFDLDARPFADQAVGLADQIRARAPWFDDLIPRHAGFRSGEAVACNWKVLLDNCTECYHCAPCHPAFVDLVDIETYTITTHGMHTMHTGRCTKPETNTAYRYGADEAVQSFTFWHVWPNITFGIMPGTENFLVFAMDPVSPTQCLTRGQHFVHGRAATASDAAREAYGDDVLWPEDKSIVESVQRGLASRG